MGIAGGIAGIFVEGKNAVRMRAVSDMLSDAAGLSLPFIKKTSEDLKKWGQEDWDHFKETYRPVADALVDDANRAPDYNRYEKEATLATARGAADANAGIRNEVSRSGAGPGSGRFADATTKLASAAAANEGIGKVMGRQRAEQVQTGKQLNVIDMGRPDPSSSIYGLGVVTKGGAEYGKYAAAIGRQATEGWGGVGKGIGQAIGSYRGTGSSGGPEELSGPGNAWSSSTQTDNSGNVTDMRGYDDGGYAEGGVIRGPGTGRSDSIPAVIDGQRPARVSDGEYKIAADVVAKIGKPRLDALIAISRG